MFTVCTCPKFINGSMQYSIDRVAKLFRLDVDIPENGEIGGSFDSTTTVTFSDINAILSEQAKLKNYTFYPLFKVHSSNNGTMFAAALVSEGVLRKSINGTYDAVKQLA